MSVSNDMVPWNRHPALTEERLRFVARVLRDARNGALETHDPGKGDANWGLGCRVLERNIFAVIQAATEENSWLGIISNGRHFVFSIGGVPGDGQGRRSCQRDQSTLLRLKT